MHLLGAARDMTCRDDRMGNLRPGGMEGLHRKYPARMEIDSSAVQKKVPHPVGCGLVSGLREELIGDERDFAAVGGPTGDVDGSLAAEQAAKDIDLLGLEGHPA